MPAFGHVWSTDPRSSALIGGKKHLLRQSHRTLGAMQMRLACVSLQPPAILDPRPSSILTYFLYWRTISGMETPNTLCWGWWIQMPDRGGGLARSSAGGVMWTRGLTNMSRKTG